MGDERYRIYPWMRRKTTVRFWGGPLHGEFMEVQRLMPDFRVALAPPIDAKYVLEDSLPDVVDIKTARYKLSSDGYPFGAIVYLNTIQELHAYVFCGID